MQFVIVEERSLSGGALGKFLCIRLDEEALISELTRLGLLTDKVEVDKLRIKEYDYDCWSVHDENESFALLIYPDPTARQFCGW